MVIDSCFKKTIRLSCWFANIQGWIQDFWKGVSFIKRWGCSLCLFHLIFLNMALRPNHFIFIGYLKNGGGKGVRANPPNPLWIRHWQHIIFGFHTHTPFQSWLPVYCDFRFWLDDLLNEVLKDLQNVRELSPVKLCNISTIDVREGEFQVLKLYRIQGECRVIKSVSDKALPHLYHWRERGRTSGTGILLNTRWCRLISSLSGKASRTHAES